MLSEACVFRRGANIGQREPECEVGVAGALVSRCALGTAVCMAVCVCVCEHMGGAGDMVY